MKDLLRKLLHPDDDGRAFTDAVLLRATGALHRRRADAEAAQTPPWDWLARWARPWVVAALVLVAAMGLIPALPWSRSHTVASPADSETMTASLLPADMALASAADVSQER